MDILGRHIGTSDIVNDKFVAEPAKIGLICTINYTHLINDNFSCELLANNTKLAPITVLHCVQLLAYGLTIG